MGVGSVLTGPFRAAGRRIRRARWFTKLALVVVVLAAVPVVFVAAVYLLPPDTAVALGKPVLAWLSDAPPLPADLEPVSERSVLLAADGSDLATLFQDVNRVQVDVADVPDVVVDALLAAEDNQFYDHPGLNHRALLRAAVVNLRSGAIEQGGSTLTQQLVKNVYLDPAQTIRRKLTEAWYALELEDRLSKDEILERYLNEAYFGQGAYGIEAAAQLYFDTPTAQLDAAQAALLVGIIPSPSRSNPVDDPAGAQSARDRVVDRMVAVGRLTDAAGEDIRASDLALDVTPPPPPAEPFFVAYVRDLLINDSQFDAALGTDPVRRERLIYNGGLRVHTTLDPRLQDAATAAVRDVMGDPTSSPLAALVTVEPATGAVRAMAVGPQRFGRCDDGVDDCPATMVNPVAPGLGGSGRQPGSAFKPFVLAAALSAEVPVGWEQRTADGIAIRGCDDDGRPYRPSNYSPDGGVKDMHAAIRVSNNVYHAKLAGLLGPQALIDAAETAGLRSGTLPDECSLSLGSGSAYPLAVASAYATFANEGVGCIPMAVTRIELGDLAGSGDERYEAVCEQRFDAEIAGQLNDLLQEPIEDGTATAAQLDRPVAGKTGTTDDYKDAWFVGYVPQLSTAAWMGYEQPRPMLEVLGVSQVTGGSIPARLWAEYMRVAVEGIDPQDFTAPPAPEMLDVPVLRNQPLREVRADYADDFTFNIEVRRVRHHRPAGTVVRHLPRAGERVEAGTLLTVFVSDGKRPAPRAHNVIDRPSEGPSESSSEPASEEQGSERPPPGFPRPRPSPGGPGPSPTPGPVPEPSPTTEPSRTRQVKFAQVVAAPPGNDLAYDGGEYVTIATGRTAVDVSGWTIHYRGGGVLRIGMGYRMSSGATLDVHTGAGNNDPPRTYFNSLTREVLDDDGGVLILRDRQGREVARREY